MEVLAAGERKAFKPGQQEYPIRSEAAVNLPQGKFVLNLDNKSIRLEWRLANADQGGPVAREAVLQ